MPLVRPEIHRYSAATGALLERVRIPGYDAVEVRRRGRAVLYRARRANGQHDVASSVFTLADGRQVVQVGPLAPGARTLHEFDAVRSYLVTWSPASIRPLRRPLPRIVRAAGGSTFAVLTDPAPRVQVGRLPDVEEEIRRSTASVPPRPRWSVRERSCGRPWAWCCWRPPCAAPVRRGNGRRRRSR